VFIFILFYYFCVYIYKDCLKTGYLNDITIYTYIYTHFRAALILYGIGSTRCWKHFSEILVHIDIMQLLQICP